MAGLSKLQAVNLMLSNIGESPVSTLSGSDGDVFVATAIVILDEVTRTVQAEEWEFNTDEDYGLTPDISGYITITDDMISVDASAKSSKIDVTVRQGKLYNKTDQTFVFDDVVYCDVSWEFTFEECPQYMRQYIAVRAARIFARRMLGDSTGQQLTTEDEVQARAQAKASELNNADVSMLPYDPTGIGRIRIRSI